MTLARAEAVKQSLHSPEDMLTWRTRRLESEIVPRVAIYARVSSIKQANEDTISVQLNTCQRLFKKHFADLGPLCLVGTFQDEAYNMEAYEEHRQFWQLLELVKQGKVNRVIVANENRIFRGSSGKLRGMINDLLREGRVVLITPEGENSFKPTQTTDRIKTAVTQELGAINKIEMVRTLQTARRTRLVESKQFRPAIHPYGFRIDVSKDGSRRKNVQYVLFEEEARIVRDIFNLYLGRRTKYIPQPIDSEPMGAKRIAHYLNSLGINKNSYRDSLQPGQREVVRSEFTAMGITHTLRNPAYAGRAMVYFHETGATSVYESDAVLQVMDVPAIIDEATFKLVEEIRTQRQGTIIHRFSRSAQDENWLHGILKCATCGSTLRGYTSSKGERYYHCLQKRRGGTEHRTFRAMDVEGALQSRLTGIFNQSFNMDQFLRTHAEAAGPEANAGELKAREGNMNAQMQVLKAKLARLVDGYAEGIIPKTEYLESKKQIDSQLESFTNQLEQIAKTLKKEKRQKPVATERLRDLEVMLQRLTEGISKYTPKFLRLILLAAVKSVDIVAAPAVDLKKLTRQEIQLLYSNGRIVPKDLKAIGWSSRRIGKLGLSGRKTPLDFDLKVIWVAGGTEIVTVTK